MKKRVDFSLIEREAKDLYSESAGRVSCPPEVIFKILFLEAVSRLCERSRIFHSLDSYLLRQINCMLS